VDLVGQTFADRYLIEERLGSGAMGEVYRARHVKIGKSFAVKVLRTELLEDEKTRQRFDREAELAGTLKHPNIVGVVDVGETPEGVRYMVMELAVGEPLSQLIGSGPMAAERAIPILRQLCDALNHAHDRGLVHRDFKPDNVIIERRPDGSEYVRIIDFGIAILRADLSSDRGRLTTAGVVLGTPHYLAPEQAFGNGDHRIDLFALGVVSYEMLTGKLPFDGEGAEVARANLTMAAPPMGVRVPFLEVDPLLEAFTLQLMNKAPELRPESGKEAGELLELIERDRAAAAELLGIDLTTSARRMIGRTDESRPAPRVSIGDTDESQPIPRATDLSIPRESVVVARARSIAPPTAPRSRRGLVIAGSAIAAVAIGIVVIVISGSSSQPAVAVGSTTEARISPSEPVTPAESPRLAADVPPDAAAAVPDAAEVEQPAIAPIVPKPKPRPAPPKPTPVVPTELTAQQLADLYIAVGRQLKVYADNKGTQSEALSSRYRLIKISDAMSTSDRRRAAAAELSAIRAAAR
jgi:serine/threonine protein kinase